jgi:hypothetical protein
MHTEDLVIDQRSDRETVETISESFPEFYIISTFAFVIETVNSVNRSTFVISSQQKEVLRVLNFVSEQQTNGFQTILSSVNVISKE